MAGGGVGIQRRVRGGEGVRDTRSTAARVEHTLLYGSSPPFFPQTSVCWSMSPCFPEARASELSKELEYNCPREGKPGEKGPAECFYRG